MIKGLFKLILLILLIGFILINPKKRYMGGISIKKNFFIFLCSVKYEGKENES